MNDDNETKINNKTSTEKDTSNHKSSESQYIGHRS